MKSSSTAETVGAAEAADHQWTSIQHKRVRKVSECMCQARLTANAVAGLPPLNELALSSTSFASPTISSLTTTTSHRLTQSKTTSKTLPAGHVSSRKR